MKSPLRWIREKGGWFECGGRLLAAILVRLGIRYRLHRTSTHVEIHEVDIVIPGLPEAFEGFRIAQFSDTHHGRYTLLEDLETLVEMANDRKPDLAVLTGDYVSHHGCFFEPCLSALRRLKAAEGILGVLGNHDYYEGIENALKAFESQGIPLLINRSILLERDGERLAIAGVDDCYHGKPDLDEALAGIPEGTRTVLLLHHPDFVERIPPGKADFVIAGHMHGGQNVLPIIGPPRLPSKYGKRYLKGLIQSRGFPVYVSRGIGTAVVPFRTNCPPEVPIFRLTGGVKGLNI